MKVPERHITRLRKMAEKDLEQVIAIDQVSFPKPWPKNSFLFEIKNNPVARLWVAETQVDQETWKISGMIVLWMIVDEVHIGTIAVHPDYRRLGIGTRLIKHSLRALQMEGAKSVYLEVRQSNTGAQALYKKFGFVISGVRKKYYVDNDEDALLLTLDHLETRDLYDSIAS